MNSMSRPMARLALTGLCALALVSTAAARTAFSQIVVFGDSLSDTGRLADLTGGLFPNPPAYFDGRASNGPIWIDHLAHRLGLGDRVANYAVAGALLDAIAVADDDPLPDPDDWMTTGNVWSDTFPGLENTNLTAQVAQHLLEHGLQADPNALYILQGGANDLPRLLAAGMNPADIVSRLATLAAWLQASGARHILAMNLPDLSLTPRVILGEAGGLLDPGTGAFLSWLCQELNQALATTLAAIQAPGVQITIGDAYATLTAVARDPGAFGFLVTDRPYMLPNYYVGLPDLEPWMPVVFYPTADPETYVFWDDFHPTTRMHEVFADDTLDSLLAAYSPRRGARAGPGTINGLRGVVTAQPGR